MIILIQKTDAAEATILGAAPACECGTECEPGSCKSSGGNDGLVFGNLPCLCSALLNAQKPQHVLPVVIGPQREELGFLEHLDLVGSTTLSVTFFSKGIVKKLCVGNVRLY